ncbi:unnamed protein product [Phaedon cochleariae]|uniref:DRBM domain-containing protein n=1 Tax=Phaedon cochleariae TaxID=80249 RepID=A0A9N9X4U4_PHACE|nr:unnamed protein product [Phaedon cochleariae]
MSQITDKSAMMVLNEVAIQKGLGPLFYELIFSRSGTHDNSFDYEVTVGDIKARGKGTSKQISKQEAARNALIILKERGIYTPTEMLVQESSKGLQAVTLSISDSIAETAPNSIGPLKELCTENRINQPSFSLISDVGPPHQKVFTFECNIDSIKTVASGRTKKIAKQLAAQEMMEKIKDVLPDLAQRCTRPINDYSVDEAAVQKYNELVGQSVVDKTIKIMDYPNAVKKLMEKHNKTMDDFKEDLQERTEESLTRILEKLELKYIKHKLQDDPVAISITLTTITPFTTIAVADYEETASNEALSQVFEILDLYMQI